MNISPIRNYYTSKIGFSSKVIDVKYGNLTQDIKDKIDIFEEKNKGEKLGSGVTATAYVLPGTEVVIKVSNPEEQYRRINGDFSSEAQRLSLIPDYLECVQKLLGVATTEKNEKYLVSTLVNGKVPNIIDNKWDKNTFAVLMKNLADMDCARLYHGDVSRNNCLIGDNQVNFIDFQYAEKFDFETEESRRKNANEYKVPYFIAPSNLQMFEESNFADYLLELEPKEAQELYKTYLIEKSKYHEIRAKNFEIKDGQGNIEKYDYLMAKFLKKLNDDDFPEEFKNNIIDINAQKMQILHAHRNVVSSVSGCANFLSLVSYYLHIVEKSNKLASNIDKMLIDLDKYIQTVKYDEPKKYDEAVELKNLYMYFKKDARFWNSITRKELFGENNSNGVFEWVFLNAKMQPNFGDACGPENLEKTKSFKHKEIMNLYEHIYEKPVKIFGFSMPTEDDVISEVEKIQRNLVDTDSFEASVSNDGYTIIEKYYKDKDELLKILSSLRFEHRQDGNYSSMFYLLKALNKVVDMKNQLSNLKEISSLNHDQKCQMQKEFNVIEQTCFDLDQIAFKAYQEFVSRAMA